MTKHMQLYGQPGWGSAMVEAMLAVAAIPYDFVDVDGFIGPDGVNHPTPGRDALATVNPLLQVPTLVLEDSTVMTESVAIALYLAERAPDAGLAPLPGSPQRAHFLRWLVWIVANIYPTFTYGDFPGRWCDAPDSLRSSTDAHRQRLWSQMDEAAGTPWFLGEAMSAIDIFLAVMIHWRPRRAWFETEAPQLAANAATAIIHPAIAPVIARNFPEG
jgi:GST-like protein